MRATPFLHEVLLQGAGLSKHELSNNSVIEHLVAFKPSYLFLLDPEVLELTRSNTFTLNCMLESK